MTIPIEAGEADTRPASAAEEEGDETAAVTRPMIFQRSELQLQDTLEQ